MTPSDLREYADFNRKFLSAVREGKKAGRSPEEIAKSWTLPEKYKGYAAPQPVRRALHTFSANKLAPSAQSEYISLPRVARLTIMADQLHDARLP